MVELCSIIIYTTAMKKVIAFKYEGQPEQVGFVPIIRSLPNRYIDTIGHFTLLDQMPYRDFPTDELNDAVESMKGNFAHPHRGIATFSYLINGSLTHYDSAGHKGTIHDGGIQWMKAGNGIIHDEHMIPSTDEDTTPQFGMQIWINLPARIKAENPEYMAIQGEDVPEVILSDDRGKVRVLIGELENKVSQIPTYSELFLYHLILNPGQSHSLTIDRDHESALAVVRGKATVNSESLTQSEMVIFGDKDEEIHIENTSETPIDVLIMGGEPYTEPIEFGGPFVMNSRQEVVQAYADYNAGKYGTIEYE